MWSYELVSGLESGSLPLGYDQWDIPIKAAILNKLQYSHELCCVPIMKN